MSISGLPSRSSLIMFGRISLLGTGLVWSLMMIAHVFLPTASSLSDFPPYGLAMASSTSSSSLPWDGATLDSSTPATFSSGRTSSNAPEPYGIWHFICDLPLSTAKHGNLACDQITMLVPWKGLRRENWGIEGSLDGCRPIVQLHDVQDLQPR